MSLEAFDIKRVDSAGRITLGKENREKLFAVQVLPNGDILLSPVVVRHEREGWLYDNVEAKESVMRGLNEAGKRQLSDRGSFAEFADAEVD